MSQKYCPRCGSLYASLKSSTCPQCFAILDVIDDAEAQKIAELKTKQEYSDEYLEAKKTSDEEFRHKSFQACLGCLGIITLTVIVSIIVVAKATTFNKKRYIKTNSLSAIAPLKAQRSGMIANELSQEISGFDRKTDDQVGVLSGTLTRINHTEYGKPGSAETIDLYYIPGGCPATDRNQFVDAVHLLAYLGNDKPKPYVFVISPAALYAVTTKDNNKAARISINIFSNALAGSIKGTKQSMILETGGPHE